MVSTESKAGHEVMGQAHGRASPHEMGFGIVVDINAGESTQPQLVMIRYDGKDATDDRGKESIAVMGDDMVALHGELRNAGVAAQPYVALSVNVIQRHVGSIEPVGQHGQCHHSALRVEGEAIEMACGCHPDVTPSVLVGSDAAFAQRALQPFRQIRRGTLWHLLLHIVEAQHTRVVVESNPQAAVIILYYILAGMTAQQCPTPLLTVEIVEGVTIVAYQSTGACTYPDEAVAVLIDVVNEVAGQAIAHGKHIKMVALRLKSTKLCRTDKPHYGNSQQTEMGYDAI